MTDTSDALGPVALDSQDLRGRLRRRSLRSTSACVACAVLAIASAVVLSALDAHLSAEQSKLDRYRGEIVAVHDNGSDSDDPTTSTLGPGAPSNPMYSATPSKNGR